MWRLTALSEIVILKNFQIFESGKRDDRRSAIRYGRFFPVFSRFVSRFFQFWKQLILSTLIRLYSFHLFLFYLFFQFSRFQKKINFFKKLDDESLKIMHVLVLHARYFKVKKLYIFWKFFLKTGNLEISFEDLNKSWCWSISRISLSGNANWKKMEKIFCSESISSSLHYFQIRVSELLRDLQYLKDMI